MAEIHDFPGRADREWRRIAEALRQPILSRTGSTRIADAVVERCRISYEAVVPQQQLHFNEPVGEEVVDTLYQITGGFIAEIAMLAEELEIQKGYP